MRRMISYGRLLKDKKGSLLLITYMIIVVFVVFGAIFVVTVGGEKRASERLRLSAVALNIAEAGIERAIFDLRQDFFNESPPQWDDGTVNGLSGLGPDTVNYYTVPYASTSLNGGSYTVEFKNASLGAYDGMWVRSTGTIGTVSETVIAFLSMVNVTPWNNAIFGGAGASGAMINGNVDIRGSVHILGEGLAPTDYAVDLGGTAELIGNNYSGLEAGLVAKIPALPTVDYNGETVSTLNAELRVKRGLVGLSGSATAGQPDTTGNTIKEKIDGSYVTDGFAGTSGTSAVHSDNGWSNDYDLGDMVEFPTLSSPYGTYASYQDYLRDNALVISDPADLAVLNSVTPSTVFSRTNGSSSISFDGSGNMSINGIVYIEGGDLNMAKSGSNNTINYTGVGSILVEGSAQIDINLVTAGNNSYPNNVVAIMTPNNIGFNEASINVMGLFYAEDTVTVQKQTDIMGTIISNYFDMGTNVPSIYQVPDTLDNLPPGLIGQDPIYAMRVVAWMRP